ncbi:MAG: hypothetical protein ABL977_15615 [Candidatus Eisenbacteria bacterium]
MRRALRLALLAVLLYAAPSGAAGTGQGTAAPRRPGIAATPPARPRARTSSVTSAHAPADTSVRSRPKVAPRTLDDIHIEGEIPVPQVLFITAREQRRLMEFQHHRYQRTSLELGHATPTPARIVVTSPTPAERKEMQR